MGDGTEAGTPDPSVHLSTSTVWTGHPLQGEADPRPQQVLGRANKHALLVFPPKGVSQHCFWFFTQQLSPEATRVSKPVTAPFKTCQNAPWIQDLSDPTFQPTSPQLFHSLCSDVVVVSFVRGMWADRCLSADDIRLHNLLLIYICPHKEYLVGEYKEI